MNKLLRKNTEYFVCSGEVLFFCLLYRYAAAPASGAVTATTGETLTRKDSINHELKPPPPTVAPVVSLNHGSSSIPTATTTAEALTTTV